MNFTKILIPVVVMVAWSIAGYLYHPSTEIAVVASLLCLVLTGLISWSSSRFGFQVKGLVKLVIVSTVASFMFSQALDVIYVVFAAPAGGRFDAVLEISAYALLLAVCGLLIARFVFRPKQDEDSEG